MRKKDTPPEVWIAHKKARKKIASAKWYAKVHAVHVAEREEKERQRIQRIQEKEQQRWQRFSPTDQDMFECRWQHRVNQWPPRPDDVPAADWVSLLGLAQQSVDRVTAGNILPATIRDNPDKMALFRKLCLSELEETYRQHRRPRSVYHYDDPRDNVVMDWLENRMRVSSSPSASINDNTRPINHDTTTSSPSSWLTQWRQRLVGHAFPWMATWLGVVFLEFTLRGQSHRWPGLLKYMYQLSHTNPAALPNQVGTNVIIHNPSHIPSSSPT